MILRALALLVSFLSQPLLAGPVFEDMSHRLPEHIYSGDWTHFVGGGLAVFDCNDDGLPDVFAAGGAAPAMMLQNTGAFTFAQIGIDALTGVTGAYPIDLNADGRLDLFVLRVGANVALKGEGGCRFSDATQAWGIPGGEAWSTAFSAWWRRQDEAPTLAIGNYVDRADPDGPFEACDENELLTPSEGRYRSTALSPGYCALSILAATDAWGRHRLRLSNDRHYYVKGGKEQMWDTATGRFLGPQDGWADVSLWGMGIAARDLTGDGSDEVMLTSMGDQLLQIARPGQGYEAAPFSIGTYAQRPHTGDDGRPSTGWHAEFGDVDNDGRADLFIAKGNVDQMPGMATRDPNNLLMQQHDGSFVERAAEAGVASLTRSRGAALADFDLDGRLDLIVSNRRAPLELYRNATANTGNWLQVDPRQAGANRFAIGARVQVIAGGVTQSIEKTIGGGHAGGQSLPLHFGLGEAEKASVRIIWPTGHVSTKEVLANQIYVMSP